MIADRPYVDRRVVDDIAAQRAAAIAAERWVLPAPTLLRTAMNAIYTAGDIVVRVGRASAPAERSHALALVLRDRGVPVVEPIAGMAADLDGFAVTAWQRIVPVDQPIDWRTVGAAVALVHTLSRSDIPVGYPVPSPTSFPWWDFDALLGETEAHIDRSASEGLQTAIERHGDWAQNVVRDVVVCHGDVHPGNVLMTADGPVLIDWDLMCEAPPGWDHAMLTTYHERWGGESHVYAEFAAGAGRALDRDPITRQFAELRNVAATLMRVRAGLTDPAARAEAERRLRYWRGDADPPTWRAQ